MRHRHRSTEEASVSKEERRPWWDEVPIQAQGDVIIGTVGDQARGAAVGKNITQTVYDVVGEPTPSDKAIIDQQLARVTASLEDTRSRLDATTAGMAEFQLKLLHSELTKTEEGQVPSANTITQIGDWLLDSVPELAESLAGLFATPAVGKVVGMAGEVAVKWVKGRFGSAGGAG
jgi:hypothetical protein